MLLKLFSQVLHKIDIIIFNNSFSAERDYKCQILLWQILQSDLYKTTTPGATQKWLSWTGGHLIKHLYKMTTSQLW